MGHMFVFSRLSSSNRHDFASDWTRKSCFSDDFLEFYRVRVFVCVLFCRARVGYGVNLGFAALQFGGSYAGRDGSYAGEMRPIVSFNGHGHMLDPQFHKCQEFMTFRLQVDRSPQKQLIFGAFLAHMTFHSGRTSAGLWPASARGKAHFSLRKVRGCCPLLCNLTQYAQARARAG